MANRRFTIAIDGPAAAGKSTVGAEVARRLDGVYFDTGLLYRAATLAGLRAGIAPDDGARLAALAGELDIQVTRPSAFDGRQSDVVVDGRDVTWELRSPEVDRTVSQVSAHPAVRRALLPAQRLIGRSGLVVMVGRDIGTVVLPDAELKIYLVASPEERARRRHEQLADSGKPQPYDDILRDILRRDELDSQRSASPLRPADDALIIDTDGLAIEDVVERIVAAANERQPA